MGEGCKRTFNTLALKNTTTLFHLNIERLYIFALYYKTLVKHLRETIEETGLVGNGPRPVTFFYIIKLQARSRQFFF